MNRQPHADPIDEFAHIAGANGFGDRKSLERVMRALPVLDRTNGSIDFPRERWEQNRWAARQDTVAAVADLQNGTVCGRCGGQGGFQGWPGWVCFECGGRGWH